jgi:hypothetical protein
MLYEPSWLAPSRLFACIEVGGMKVRQKQVTQRSGGGAVARRWHRWADCTWKCVFVMLSWMLMRSSTAQGMTLSRNWIWSRLLNREGPSLSSCLFFSSSSSSWRTCSSITNKTKLGLEWWDVSLARRYNCAFTERKTENAPLVMKFRRGEEQRLGGE